MERYFIVVPCYNEQEVLPETIKRLGDCLKRLTGEGLASPDSRVLFVNDGSSDRTWELITAANGFDSRFAGLCLDRNRGHQTALTEGLMCAREFRAVSVSIDADLQDDVDAIYEMAKKRAAGAFPGGGAGTGTADRGVPAGAGRALPSAGALFIGPSGGAAKPPRFDAAVQIGGREACVRRKNCPSCSAAWYSMRRP